MIHSTRGSTDRAHDSDLRHGSSSGNKQECDPDKDAESQALAESLAAEEMEINSSTGTGVRRSNRRRRKPTQLLEEIQKQNEELEAHRKQRSAERIAEGITREDAAGNFPMDWSSIDDLEPGYVDRAGIWI